MDRAKGSTDITDILNIAFISPNLAKHDIQFQIGDDLGSDHLPIEISVDTFPLPHTHTHTHTHRNTFTNHTKYKFDQTDRELFESTLKEALDSADFSGLLSTSDLDKYADFIQLQSALQSIKLFRKPKACDLRVTQFLMNP